MQSPSTSTSPGSQGKAKETKSQDLTKGQYARHVIPSVEAGVESYMSQGNWEAIPAQIPLGPNQPNSLVRQLCVCGHQPGGR